MPIRESFMRWYCEGGTSREKGLSVGMRFQCGPVSTTFYEEERTPAIQPVSNVVK